MGVEMTRKIMTPAYVTNRFCIHNIIFRTQDWFEKYRLQEIASAENSIGVLGFAVVVIH